MTITTNGQTYTVNYTYPCPWTGQTVYVVTHNGQEGVIRTRLDGRLSPFAPVIEEKRA